MFIISIQILQEYMTEISKSKAKRMSVDMAYMRGSILFRKRLTSKY